MDLDQVFHDVAHRAAKAVHETMAGYSGGNYEDEDDMTGVLVGALSAHIGMQGGPIRWNAKVMRHRRGVAAEESVSGADLLIHISLSTPELKYSKGVLVQAKRTEPDLPMTNGEHKRLLDQCDKMLAITPDAFVFNFSKRKMRCGSALRVKGSSTDLVAACPLTPYRFFLEFFRCTTGDQRITSHHFRDLNIPAALMIKGVLPDDSGIS